MSKIVSEDCDNSDGKSQQNDGALHCKEDISAKFKEMGARLGWFKYKDIDSAIKTLSANGKKRSTKARRKKENNDDSHVDTKQNKSRSIKDKLSTRTHGTKTTAHSMTSPLKERKCSKLNIQFSDSDTDTDVEAPLERKYGSTDLIRDAKLISKLTKLSDNKENDNGSVSSQKLIDRHRCSSSSPESDNLDIGIPIQESTRIHSRASIDNILDIQNNSSINCSKDNSYNQLDIKKSCKKKVSIGHFQLVTNKKNENGTDLCFKLKDLDLSNGNDDNRTSVSSVNELYKTAVNENDDVKKTLNKDVNSRHSVYFDARMDSVDSKLLKDVEKSRRSVYYDARTGDTSSSGSSSTELSPPHEKSFKRKQKESNEKTNLHQSEGSEELSSFEVADMSVQTDKTNMKSTDSDINLKNDVSSPKAFENDHISQNAEENVKNTSKSSESGDSSFVEVNDVSIQMSPKSDKKSSSLCSSDERVDNSSKFTKGSNSSESKLSDSGSFVEVQDISLQVEGSSKNNSGSNVSTELPTKNKTIFFDAESDLDDDFGSVSEQVSTRPLSIISAGKSLVNFSSDEDDVFERKPSVQDCSSDDSDLDIQLSSNGKLNQNKEKSTTPSTNGSSMTQDHQKIPSNEEDNTTNKTWRSKKKYDSDSSEDEDQLESFFQTMKSKSKPVEAEESEEDSLDNFIVDDDEVSSSNGSDKEDEDYLPDLDEDEPSSDEDDLYITSVDDYQDKKTSIDVLLSSEDSSEEDLPVLPKPKKLPVRTPKRNTEPQQETYRKSIKSERQPQRTPLQSERPRQYSFLRSLNKDTPLERCDPAAIGYVKNFTKTKEELTSRLFKLYNLTVFDNKMPDDLPITWNKRLLKTAGYCQQKKSRDGKTSASIELSVKVLDSAERTRDTLLHELCHAAVWLLNGVNDGHGPYWKYWASKANKVHPDLPVPKRCHSYKIETKYKYQCQNCKYEIGRHSKSLNTDRFVCGKCKGQFILLNKSGKPVNATPNKFALFVKENYKEVKNRDKSAKHADIMSALSKEFAKQKLI